MWIGICSHENEYLCVFISPATVSMDVAEEEPVTMDTDFLQADWLQELPEDLDMLIAQRDFEGAVDTVEKGITLVFCVCVFFLIK